VKNIKEEARTADFLCDLLFSGQKKVYPLGKRRLLAYAIFGQ
jgi:hypothetical protein